MNNDREWGWQPHVPATGGVRTAGIPPALSAAEMNRANFNSIPPHQAYSDPNLARVDGQTPGHSFGYPIQQVDGGHFMGSSPIFAPQPAGAADTEPRVWYNGQGGADVPGNDRRSDVPFEGHGAFSHDTPEGLGGGGVEAFWDVGHESGVSPWTTPTATAGEYGAQAQQDFLPGYIHGAQSAHYPYEPQTREYVEQNGMDSKFEFCQSRG